MPRKIAYISLLLFILPLVLSSVGYFATSAMDCQLLGTECLVFGINIAGALGALSMMGYLVVITTPLSIIGLLLAALIQIFVSLT